MKILHFSTSDIRGGAAKAAYRLHTALRQAGHRSKMIVRYKSSIDPDVISVGKRFGVLLWRRGVRLLPAFAFYGKADFNPDLQPGIRLEASLAKIDEPVDVLCLHWTNGLLSSDDIAKLARRFGCPVVWMLTDQEPYTGGCHYTYDCQGYTMQCGRCPQLSTNYDIDRSRIVWNNKARLLAPLPITFVSSCRWTSDRFRESSLFKNHRLEDIGDAMDTSIFRPGDQQAARKALNIPLKAKVIFFGSFSLDNPRKGMTYLAEALRRLPQQVSPSDANMFLLCAGHNPHVVLQGLRHPYRSLGYLEGDCALALAYQAADVFVCPSVHEAGAMMVPEAMLCGTPVVAFDTGNAPDLIRTMETGYRASYKDSSDLANGISAIINAPNLSAMREAACRTARQRHAPEIVSAQQVALFTELKAEYKVKAKSLPI